MFINQLSIYIIFLSLCLSCKHDNQIFILKIWTNLWTTPVTMNLKNIINWLIIDNSNDTIKI